MSRVAVIGATGQFGYPLSLNLAAEGAEVLAISRAPSKRNSDQLAALGAAGCELGFCADTTDHKALVDLLMGCETVVMVTRATPKTLRAQDPLYLKAAAEAGVRRFVPNEFGAHTLGMPKGRGELFDAKKEMHDLIDAAGLAKTLIYPGLNFDYCLPNLRFFREITTFGKLDLPLVTHHIDDIGKVSAKIILDERTAGKAVQLYENRLTQHDMIKLLEESWPDHQFSKKHTSTETIMEMMEHGSTEITSKAGLETDGERGEINYVCYISGEVTNIGNPHTLNASKLYPDFQYKSPAEALADPAFVFDASQKS